MGDITSFTTLPILPLTLFANAFSLSSSSSKERPANNCVTINPIALNVAVSTPKPTNDFPAATLSSTVLPFLNKVLVLVYILVF